MPYSTKKIRMGRGYPPSTNKNPLTPSLNGGLNDE